MAAHVFDEDQHLLALEQRAAVHRASRFVGALLQPDGVDDAVKLALRQRGGGQLELVDLGHQVAKHAALAAAGGHHFFGGASLDVRDALTGLDRSSADIPVDRDRFDLVRRLHQALVAQKAQHQQLRLGAQRHQGDQLALVHIDGEGPFGRYRDRAGFAKLVDGAHLLHQRRTGAGEVGQRTQDFFAGAATAAAGAGAEAAAAAGAAALT